MDRALLPQLGHFVKVLRGREFGHYAVVVSLIDSRFVLIADGDKRKFDCPKKKNIIHLQVQDEISSEVVTSLQETGRVTNGKLRFALSKFKEKLQSEAHEKGE